MKESAYKQAGVDIEAGAELVERIKPHVKKTNRAGVMAGLGGFGAFFDVKAAGFQDPVLVSATDGVGTKLKVAIESGMHETVGIDLVAMCVNDLIVQGAEPLFFLDYFATGKLDTAHAEAVIAGIAEGCRQAGCALIGGETAEMPGMYGAGDYDLAGFAVGAVEREAMLTGAQIAEGDVVLGLAASGLHSNGYSLVRRVVAEICGGDFKQKAPFAPEMSLGEALLTPTKIYVKALLEALKLRSVVPHTKGAVKGLAHITGGGLIENLPRVLPEGCGAKLDAQSWPLLPVFGWLAKAGGLSAADMGTTFNCGIGMTVICAPQDEAAVTVALNAGGESVYRIGEISGGEGVRIENAEHFWGVKG